MSVPDVSRNPLGYMGSNLDSNPVTLPVSLRAPTTADVYPINTTWPYSSSGSITLYVSLGGGNWQVGDNPYATTSSPGVVQLATNAETVTGSNATHAVTPANVTARLAAPGAIGGTTPAAGTFTSVTASTGNIVATLGNISSTAGSVSAGTTVTAGTGMTVTTGNLAVSAGNANVTGNVIASKSSAGTNVTAQVTNSDNTNAASNGGVEIAAGGASGGDPYLSFQISGVGASTMTMGLDNSASDILVISNSSSLGTSNALTLTQAGALSATTTITAGTGIVSTTGDIKASAGQIIAGGDTGGVASCTSITNAESTTISTGVGSVKMSTTNAADNAAWIKIYIGNTAYWIPAWTTNAP